MLALWIFMECIFGEYSEHIRPWPLHQGFVRSWRRTNVCKGKKQLLLRGVCVCVCVLRNENGVRGFLMYGTTWWNRSAKRCLSFLIIVCSHLPHGYSGQSFCQWPSRRSLQTPMGSSLFSTRFHPSILFWCHREMKNMLVDYMNYWHLFISSWGRSTPIGSLSWEMVINFPRRYDPQALQRNSAPAGGDFPADVNCWDGKMQKRNQQVMFGWVN